MRWFFWVVMELFCAFFFFFFFFFCLFFTCKRNWYQFFTRIRIIGTNSSHPKKHRSQVWRILTNSLHVRNYQRILHMCEELVPIRHTREKVAPALHRCDEYLPILHTSTWEIWAQILDPKINRNWPYANFTLANVTYWYQFFLWVWNLRNKKFTV